MYSDGMSTSLDSPGLPSDLPVHVSHWHRDLTPESPLLAAVAGEGPEPLHAEMHAGVEVGIVLVGHMERYLPGARYRVAAGEVWVVPQGEAHGWRVDDPTTTRVVLGFLPDFLEDALDEGRSWRRLVSLPVRAHPRVMDPAARARVLRLGQAMRTEIEEQQTGWQEALRLQLSLLLLLLHRAWYPPVELKAADATDRGRLLRVMPALRLLERAPCGRVTVQQAASACGLSISQFSRVFRMVMGMGFGSFCIRSRMAAAARLLMTTQLTTEAIAEQTGFVDASHLYHAFVNQHGVSPSEYRRREGQEQRPDIES